MREVEVLVRCTTFILGHSCTLNPSSGNSAQIITELLFEPRQRSFLALVCEPAFSPLRPETQEEVLIHSQPQV